MTEIERLARALAEVTDGGAGNDMDFMWQHRVPEVRAILQAMREPSAAMSAAGFHAGQYEVTAGFSYSEHTSDPAELCSDAPNVIWQAMIDHILNEPA